MEMLRKGLSDNYPLKAHIERVFGNKQFLKIKDYPCIERWRETIFKLFKSYKKTIEKSIRIKPSFFDKEIDDFFSYAEKRLSDEQKIETDEQRSETELFSLTLALQSELIYLLLGNLSDCCGINRSLKSDWNLSKYRETQIVQSSDQKRNYIEETIYKTFTNHDLEEFSVEYRKSKRNIDFFTWVYSEKIEKRKE
jgi:hypothetical protein